ncbi:MAG TPA: hypothetical protein VGI28_11640 [Stellaceae bacterium]|jgi:hypothetical protein
MSGRKIMLPTDRLDYSPITGRRRLELPGGVRRAVWIIVNVEQWDPTEPMPRTVLTPRVGGAPMPYIQNWARLISKDDWRSDGNPPRRGRVEAGSQLRSACRRLLAGRD